MPVGRGPNLRWLCLWLLLACGIGLPLARGEELARSSLSDRFWIDLAGGISPDSGVFHGEGSAVADRRDITLRYQTGALGLFVNWHRLVLDSTLEQESYQVSNSVYGAGLSLRYAPVGEKGGMLGGSHFLGYIAAQSGRSDYHYFEGASGGAKTEVTAGVAHASGVASGVDFYFPAVLGLWLFAGAGWETNSFKYRITTDPNNDGKVNIRQTFTFLRGGLSFSF